MARDDGRKEAAAAGGSGSPYYATGSADGYHRDQVIRRISPWAVLAGAVVGIVTLFLLSLLGVGVGLTTVDPAPGQSGVPDAGSFGLGAGIWSALTFLVALFAAGWVAARLAGDPKRLDGLLHGVVAWAIATLFVLWMTASAVSSILGGVFSVASNLASTSTQGVQAVAGNAEGMPWQQVQQRVQQRLEEALPAGAEVDQEALTSAVRELVTGGTNREEVIDILVEQGGLSQQEAQEFVQDAQATYDEFRQQALEAADAAANTISQAAIWSFLALLLGGLAAAGGGWLGTPRDDLSHGGAAT